MPSIHPSESPPLGWLVPCLAVSDLPASMAFYAALDLHPYGGNPDEGWSMLRNRAIEIHLFHRHIVNDLLNFRGGDPAALRRALAERDIPIAHEEGPRSFTIRDPDGRRIFFDSGEEEARSYAAGQVLTDLDPATDVHDGTGLDLGNLTYCLACGDLPTTMRFYETLGLVRGGGGPEHGAVILARPDHRPGPGRRLVATYLSLFAGTLSADMLRFGGGNVGAIARTLDARTIDLQAGVETRADGTETLLLRDPDGRPVCLETTPAERLYATE